MHLSTKPPAGAAHLHHPVDLVNHRVKLVGEGVVPAAARVPPPLALRRIVLGVLLEDEVCALLHVKDAHPARLPWPPAPRLLDADELLESVAMYPAVLSVELQC
jgi:hypothetical protein